MSRSMYAQYVQEREGKEIVESEKGFATYTFLNNSVYIEDIYTHPEHRKSGVAAEFADQIADIAREKGCLKMYGSVVPSARGSTESMKVLLAYGFKLDSSTNNFIIFIKDLI